MTIKEVGYIRNALNQGGKVQPPHYVDSDYQAGGNVEGGFEVADKPEKPVHETVHVGIAATIINDDMRPHYLMPEFQPTEHTQVVHAGPQVRYVFEGETTEADRRAEKAEAAAQAVKAAIMRGELDPSIFE